MQNNSKLNNKDDSAGIDNLAQVLKMSPKELKFRSDLREMVNLFSSHFNEMHRPDPSKKYSP